MEPVIRSLTLKGFRSIRAERIEFDNPTFLVGRNGSGKSNIVDAFAFLAEAMASPLQTVVARRGGVSSLFHKKPANGAPSRFGIAVRFGELGEGIVRGDYGFELQALEDHGFEVTHERCIVELDNGRQAYFDRSETPKGSGLATTITERNAVPLLDRDSLGLPLIGGLPRFAPVFRTLANARTYSIDPARLRETQNPDNGLVLLPDGSNAASVLREIERAGRGGQERIGELLAATLPHQVQVRPLRQGNKMSFEFTQEWGDGKRLTFDAFSMSDGTLRTLGLLVAAFQPSTPSVMVIEEPEASIHPGALGLILDVLQLTSRETQVIVTTHSPELLEDKWIQGHHLRVVTWEEGRTRVRTVDQGTRRALQEHLMGAGELLRSNALDPDPHPLSGDEPQIELFQRAG